MPKTEFQGHWAKNTGKWAKRYNKLISHSHLCLMLWSSFRSVVKLRPSTILWGQGQRGRQAKNSFSVLLSQVGLDPLRLWKAVLHLLSLSHPPSLFFAPHRIGPSENAVFTWSSPWMKLMRSSIVHKETPWIGYVIILILILYIQNSLAAAFCSSINCCEWFTEHRIFYHCMFKKHKMHAFEKIICQLTQFEHSCAATWTKDISTHPCQQLLFLTKHRLMLQKRLLILKIFKAKKIVTRLLGSHYVINQHQVQQISVRSRFDSTLQSEHNNSQQKSIYKPQRH